MMGNRRQEHQGKQWLDDLLEWTKLALLEFVWLTEDHRAYIFAVKITHAAQTSTVPLLNLITYQKVGVQMCYMKFID